MYSKSYLFYLSIFFCCFYIWKFFKKNGYEIIQFLVFKKKKKKNTHYTNTHYITDFYVNICLLLLSITFIQIVKEIIIHISYFIIYIMKNTFQLAWKLFFNSWLINIWYAMIPSSVRPIGDYALCDCSSLMKITISLSVTSIGDYSFQGCSSLKKVSIPSSVKTVGNNAFTKCSSLDEVDLPSSITELKGF